MKRTNLMIDEELLHEAKRVLQAASLSGAVNTALAEAIKMQKVRNLTAFFGKNLWSGDLAEMRDDKPPTRRKKRAS